MKIGSNSISIMYLRRQAYDKVSTLFSQMFVNIFVKIIKIYYN